LPRKIEQFISLSSYAFKILTTITIRQHIVHTVKKREQPLKGANVAYRKYAKTKTISCANSGPFRHFNGGSHLKIFNCRIPCSLENMLNVSLSNFLWNLAPVVAEPEPQRAVSFFLLKPAGPTSKCDFFLNLHYISHWPEVKDGAGPASICLPGAGSAAT
jgi:hypothetical protein